MSALLTSFEGMTREERLKLLDTLIFSMTHQDRSELMDKLMSSYMARAVKLDRIIVEEQFKDWWVHFPRTHGKSGDKKVITVKPKCHFRGEKILAFDSGNGYATRVGTALVGVQIQHPDESEAVLTATFDKTAVGNGMKWDVCRPTESISITISFLEDGWWEGTVFGKGARDFEIPEAMA